MDHLPQKDQLVLVVLGALVDMVDLVDRVDRIDNMMDKVGQLYAGLGHPSTNEGYLETEGANKC